MKKNIQSIIGFIIALFSIGGIAQAQTTSDPNVNEKKYTPFNSTANPANKLRNISDYPVNNFQGQVDISIPLYTIEEGDISVPITLRYNAGGAKIGDNSGIVALGWSIDAGGQITHVMNDVDDKMSDYVKPDITQMIGNNHAYNIGWFRIMEEYKDNEYDVFNYSFPGGSGKFYIKEDTHMPVFSPYKPYKADWPTYNSGATTNQDFSSMKIIDDKGIKHTFLNQCGQAVMTGGFSCIMPLYEILSQSNPNNKVSFAYNNNYSVGQILNSYTSGKYIVDHCVSYNNVFCKEPGTNTVHHGAEYLQYALLGSGNVLGDSEPISTDNPFPSDIYFSKGRVKFTMPASGIYVSGMEVYNLKNELVFAVRFDQSLYNNNVHRKLDAVRFVDASNNLAGKYSFEYNQAHDFPSGSSPCMDFWGYYNGKNSGAQNIVPKWTNYPFTSFNSMPADAGYVDRNADESYLKSYVINKVTHPNGGYTLFDFEIHKEENPGNNGTTGSGLRIKNIKNYETDGSLNTQKSYTYVSGIMEMKPTVENFHYVKKGALVAGGATADNDLKYVRSIFTASAIISLEPKGSSVVYPTVKELDGIGSATAHETQMEYDYEATPLGQYDLEPNDCSCDYTYRQSPPFFNYERPWNSGNLLVKTQGNIKTEYLYDTLTHEVMRDVKQTRHFFQYINPECDVSGVGVPTYGYDYDDNLYPIFHLANHYIISGEKRLASEKQTYLGQNGPQLQSQTNYTYASNLYDQVTKVTTVNSKGDSTRVINTYAWNTTNTNPVYATMVSKNMISQQVQTDKTLNYNAITSAKTDYKDWGNGIILPEKLWQKEGNGSWMEKSRVDLRDDKGNPLQTTDNGVATTSYFYDYKQQYATATVTNATYNDVSVSSFEGIYNGSGDVNLGAWELNDPNAITDAEHFTGNKCLALHGSGGNRNPWNPLTNGKKYIVSFWKKGGTASSIGFANGANISFTEGITVNGWTYYEGIFTATNSSNINFWYAGGGTPVYIDELRLYPLNAQMQTTTYKPLVGITSQCDARNMVTYYEYDDFGRETLVKDMYGKILKKTEYATQITE